MNNYENGGMYGNYHGYNTNIVPAAPINTQLPQIIYDAPATPQKEKHRDKKSRKGVKVLAMLLACAIFGFGGAAAALGVFGGFGASGQAPVQPPVALTSNALGEASVSDIAAFASRSVVMVNTEVNAFNMFGSQTVQAAGSGVIISSDGYIATNFHVVEGAANVKVTLADGSEYPAYVVGGDKDNDIAVLKIDATGLTAASIGDSEKLAVGEFCLAIGNPLGTLGGTVTDGIISALDREITIGETDMNLIQTNAAVSPGNSGGGLFNSKGELVGIVNAKMAGQGAEGIGFAIPINTAFEIIENIKNGSSPLGKAGLGITVNTVSEREAADYYGYASLGVYVEIVNSGSAAEKAGILPGDRIVSADGRQVNTNEDLVAAIEKKGIGDEMELTLERNGEILTVLAVLQVVNNI